jgi:hypothetical protein
MHQVWPRSASLTHLAYPIPNGEVENISPAIETLIAMLIQAEENVNETPLRLTFDLEPNQIPGPIVLVRPRQGADPADNEEYYQEYIVHWSRIRYFSMDMPNLVEKWRAEYSIRTSCRSIDILWNVQTESVRMEEKRIIIITEKGWSVLEEEDLNTTCDSASCRSYDPKHNPPFNTPQFHMVRFLLRRCPIKGILVAADPSPFRIPDPDA